MLLKSHLRTQMIQRRNQLSAGYREACSREINHRLIIASFFQQAQTILFYMAFQSEVDVSLAMQAAWKQGKRVVLPKVQPDDRTMLCFQIGAEEEYIVGAYGIREPLSSSERQVSPDEIDLAIVPGVAFDHLGYRLGYGGGYFDRFFAHTSTAQTRIGIAYPEQVVPSVYPQAHDVAMHALVTGEESTSVTLHKTEGWPR
jgi:5-formyltetrahydrofolate cyclo-ligase